MEQVEAESLSSLVKGHGDQLWPLMGRGGPHPGQPGQGDHSGQQHLQWGDIRGAVYKLKPTVACF